MDRFLNLIKYQQAICQIPEGSVGGRDQAEDSDRGVPTTFGTCDKSLENDGFVFVHVT